MPDFRFNQDKILTVPLTGAAILLKPVVFIEGEYYCVLLGQDQESGVFARGRTLEKAMDVWHEALKKHIATADEEDYIVVYIKSSLHETQKTADLRAFYDQFKS